MSGKYQLPDELFRVVGGGTNENSNVVAGRAANPVEKPAKGAVKILNSFMRSLEVKADYADRLDLARDFVSRRDAPGLYNYALRCRKVADGGHRGLGAETAQAAKDLLKILESGDYSWEEFEAILGIRHEE